MLLFKEWRSEAWSSDVGCQIKEAVRGKIHDVLSPLSPAFRTENAKNSFGQCQSGGGRENYEKEN